MRSSRKSAAASVFGIALDDGQDYSEAAKYQQWSKFYLKLSMFLNIYDPFYIYKMDSASDSDSDNRHRIYRAAQLRMERNKLDLRRHNWNMLLIALSLYICSKFFLIALLQLTIHAYHTTNDNGLWPDFIDWTLIIRMHSAIGNPLSAIPDVATFIYIMSSTAGLSYVIFIPHYYSRRPMDIADIRFLFEPKREVRRVLLLVERGVKDVLISIDSYRLHLLKRQNCHCRHLGQVTRSSQLRWRLLDESFRLLRERESANWDLIPRHYSIESLRRIQCDVSLLVLVCCPSLFAGALAMMFFLPQAAAGARCNSARLASQSEQCFFNLREKLVLFEIGFSLLCWAQTLALHLTMLGLTSRSQLNLIDNIRQDMQACLSRFRLCWPPQESRPRPDCYIDKLLLETLIKVQVSRGDLMKGTQCLAQLMAPFLLNGALMVTTTFLTDTMATPESRMLRRNIFFITWLLTNGIALICAFVSAHVSDLERLFWSLLAENAERNLGGNCAEIDDFAPTLWRKLAYSVATTRDQFTVTPFCVPLTYKKILELNFFVVSLYALLVLRGY